MLRVAPSHLAQYFVAEAGSGDRFNRVTIKLRMTHGPALEIVII
ncbi:MAG: hypothetical protein ACFB12_17655 [Leptolyngbyaceae cyanobacterium]